jgi:pyridoxamine 5'-phosphate oxidase
MIKFIKLNKSEPYRIFKEYYSEAHKFNQRSLEAMTISSYDVDRNEVDSRFVNLKYINDENWVFFTNYLSPKANQFKSHDQVSCIFFWNKINIQIRIKANIKKIDSLISDKYFQNREKIKNALSISSNQSKKTSSYKGVVDKYNDTLEKNKNLLVRPTYWGGYSVKPYYFEFWEGHSSRVNRRVSYYKGTQWKKSFLQP